MRVVWGGEIASLRDWVGRELTRRGVEDGTKGLSLALGFSDGVGVR